MLELVHTKIAPHQIKWASRNSGKFPSMGAFCIARGRFVANGIQLRACGISHVVRDCFRQSLTPNNEMSKLNGNERFQKFHGNSLYWLL